MSPTISLYAAISAVSFFSFLYIVFFWLHSTRRQIESLRYVQAQKHARFCVIGSYAAPFLFFAPLVMSMKELGYLSTENYQLALWAAVGVSALIGVVILCERVRFRLSAAFDDEAES